MNNQDNAVIYMVINPIKPYISDVFHICSLPSGFEIRTRWREKWLSSSLKNYDSTNSGCRILLTVYDKSSDMYYPVRWGELKAIHNVGGIYRFDFTVKSFASINASGKAINYRMNTIKEFSNYFKDNNVDYIDSNAPILERRSCFLKYDYSSIVKYLGGNSEPESEVEAWGSVTECLSEIPEFRHKEFIKIVDCRKLDGTPVAVNNGKLNLASNKFYEIRVLQHIYGLVEPSELVQHEMTLDAPSDHITILKARANIVGKYDYISLKFKTNSLSKTESSYLIFSVNNAQSELNSYYVELPAVIKSNAEARSVVSLILSAVFAVLLITNPIHGYFSNTFIEILRILLVIATTSSKDAISYILAK